MPVNLETTGTRFAGMPDRAHLPTACSVMRWPFSVNIFARAKRLPAASYALAAPFWIPVMLVILKCQFSVCQLVVCRDR